MITQKVHEIVSFSKKDNGEFEYYGELKGRKKCFTRKAIVASTPLFAEVIKFYEKKFATFFGKTNTTQIATGRRQPLEQDEEHSSSFSTD